MKLLLKDLLYLEGVGSSWPRRDIIFISVLIPILERHTQVNTVRSILDHDMTCRKKII